MSQIDLRQLDLNLLVIFEVLMSEGSVTRAAVRLNRTQSAVSHALKRLRVQVGDPLMVKADGHMRPSPFALTLIQDVRPILRNIQRVVAPPEPFDPVTSTRVFRIAAPAFSALVSAVFRRVHALAPRVSLEWMLPNAEALSAVAEGRIDLAHIGGDSRLPDGVDVHVTTPFTWVTFLRKNHPALSRWDANAWTRWPHVVVSIGNAVRNPIDDALTRLGLQRTIGARIPEFSGVAPLLAGTDMLGTFPPLALAEDVRVYGLVAPTPPVPLAPFSSRFLWSSRLANDPASRWIRNLVLDTYTRLHERAEAQLSGLGPRNVRNDLAAGA